MWTNYHSHSKYCDGKGELEDYIFAAKEAGIKSIGLSSHAPLPFECKWSMEEHRLPTYLDEIESLKRIHKDIEIYKGLEVDYVPGVVSPVTYGKMLDYSIGSIHFVDSLPDGRRWEIDNTQAIFQEGLEAIFKGNIKDAVVRYFELTREMLYGSTPQIIGHLDKIKIQSKEGKLFNETDAWYQQQVKKVIDVLVHGDFIVEVNTRGIYQKKSPTPYPSPWILEILQQKNIAVTISSDAHQVGDLTNHFTETAALLSKIGFKTVSVLVDGKWKQVPFDADGVKL